MVVSVLQRRGQKSAAAAVGQTDAVCLGSGLLTYPCFTALFLFTSMVVMECLAPDWTSQSTFHWAFFDLVWSRFTPFFALTLQKTTGEKEWDESILLKAVIYVQGQRWTPFVCSGLPLCIASWQKQFYRWINNRDEWRWHKVIHETRRLGLFQVTVFTNTFYKIKSTNLCTAPTGHLYSINHWHLKVPKFTSHAL